MDEEGNIYDLEGNFIGVANPEEIEDLGDYEQNEDEDYDMDT
jgi:hypothetical protein